MGDPTPLATSAQGLSAATWRSPQPDDDTWFIAVHDLTANLLHWDLVASRIDGRHPFAALDLRGRGGSFSTGGSAGLHAHARDVIAVADALEARRIVVVGHGFGAAVAAAVAEAAPTRVAAIVAVDGPVALAGGPSSAALLDPTSERSRLTYPTRDAYLQRWQRQPWVAAAGLDRAARRAVLSDLGGSGFAWQVRLSQVALATDVADLASPTAVVPVQVRARSVVVHSAHGHTLTDSPVPLVDLGLARHASVDAPHAAMLLVPAAASSVAAVLDEVAADLD